MSEKRIHVTRDQVFAGDRLPQNFYLQAIEKILQPDSDWGDEVSLAQYIGDAEKELLLSADLDELLVMEEIGHRFYSLIGMVEADDPESMERAKMAIMSDLDPERFHDYTEDVFETRDRLNLVNQKFGLPAKKAMLACLTWNLYDGGYLLTAPIMMPIDAIKERFAGDLKGYLQYVVESSEACNGYSYGVDKFLIEKLKERIASL